MDRGRHQRLAEQHAGVVDEVARGEAVRAVEDHVVAREHVAHVGSAQFQVVRDDLDRGIEREQSLACHDGLGTCDVLAVEQHLALQV